MKYRKKPVVINAFRWQPDLLGIELQIPDWLNDARASQKVFLDGTIIRIKTLEGRMACNPGDWIIQGIQGELYPCKDDIFRETYEREEGQLDDKIEHFNPTPPPETERFPSERVTHDDN